MQMLSIDTIKLDERCQPRASINPEIINEYADAMTQGAEFPPLTVYRDGGTFYLADGFHRIAAARQAGQAHVVCNVEAGTIRDAILHAVGANATHGQRRTNLDKRRAVETLLKDDEWKKWSDNEIARRCAVHPDTVGTYRKSLSETDSDLPSERTYTDRYGNQRVMNTANIGRSSAPKIDLEGLDFDAEDVDEDTGEIRDPAPTPRSSHPLPPGQRQAPKGQPDTLEFMDYGPDDPEPTYESMANAIVREYGKRAASRVAHYLREAA